MTTDTAGGAAAGTPNINPGLTTVPVTALRLDPANARAHGENSIKAIAASLRAFGQQKPLVALQDGTVIAGNGMLTAALGMGWDRIGCVVFEDATRAKAYAVADNRTAELSTWDVEALAASLKEIENVVPWETVGFDEDALRKTIGSDARLLDAVGLGAVVDTDVPSVDSRAISSVVGGVYMLGPHTLVCGDSAASEGVRAVFDTSPPHMLWTDPPYGVSYVGKTKDALTVENDDLTEEALQKLLETVFGYFVGALQNGGAVYSAAPPGPLSYVFETVLRRLGVWSQTLIWVKDAMVMGRSRYHYKHEPIYFGVKGAPALFFSADRTQTSVLEFDRPKASAEHPTMKPVGLIAHCIRNSTLPGMLVADPFAGSGSTLIACAETDRKFVGVEIRPEYCDVIRRRWTRWATEHRHPVGEGALV